jgi:hypothetical protein
VILTEKVVQINEALRILEINLARETLGDVEQTMVEKSRGI